tara:strand:- start:243 stop:1778 length:1536 start_codon:yes stop_codon:yes gene_type:complete
MDFEVPDYINGIDMDKSFININYNINTTETDDSVIGVHNFITLFNGVGDQASNALFNSCLVRNVTLTAARAGQLESIQRADLINQVIQGFSKNIGDIQGELHESISNFPFEFNYGSNQARNLVTEGELATSLDITRYERTGVMRVNLRDVLGLGTSVLNLSSLGSLRLHIEANLNKFTLKEVPCFVNATQNGGHSQYFTASDGAQDLSGANLSELTFAQTDQMFLSKKNCPFHLGMKVNFVLAGAGNTNTSIEVLIKKMVWEATERVAGPPIVPAGAKVTVTFSAPILNSIVTGGAITGIRMYPVQAGSATLEYVGAELVVKTVASPPVSRGLQYRTITTISDFAGANDTFNRSYEITGNTVASLVCFDTAESGIEFSYSSEPTLSQYQIFVDNVGVTDRPVPIRTAAPYSKSPLHSIILEKTLEVMGIPYKNNLDVLPKQISGAADLVDSEVIPESEIFTAEAKNRTLVLPAIYKSDGTRKLLTVDLVKTAADKTLNLNIFSHVNRTIDY